VMSEEQNDMNAHQLIYAPHPALATAVAEFPENNTEYRRAISQHMKDLCHKHRGIGLAANQINLNACVAVVHIQREMVTMFNPQIHEVSNDLVLMSEGCLSEPGLYLKIKRPDAVMVSWENEVGDRVEQEKLYGMDARVFLHEFDHLQGVMFTDRVGKTKLEMGRRKQVKRMEAAAQRILADMKQS